MRHVWALLLLFDSALVLPNKIFTHNANQPTLSEAPDKACATPSLRQVKPQTTPGFQRSPALALGDFNKDGRLDFLAGTLDVSARFLNSGGSNFQVLPNLDSLFQDAAIADLDQDDYRNAAVLNADVVSIHLGYNPTWPVIPEMTSTVVG